MDDPSTWRATMTHFNQDRSDLEEKLKTSKAPTKGPGKGKGQRPDKETPPSSTAFHRPLEARAFCNNARIHAGARLVGAPTELRGLSVDFALVRRGPLLQIMFSMADV
eukprot:6035727-Pyramimonas_sp.AAC.1